LYLKAFERGVHMTLHALPRVLFEADDIVDALGIVVSLTVPLQAVDVNEVDGILPDADIAMDFVPSELWLIVCVASTAFTQAFSVMVKYLLALVDLPPIDIVNVPVPYVWKPVLFLL
jgi:hypothetical protein